MSSRPRPAVIHAPRRDGGTRPADQAGHLDGEDLARPVDRLGHPDGEDLGHLDGEDLAVQGLRHPDGGCRAGASHAAGTRRPADRLPTWTVDRQRGSLITGHIGSCSIRIGHLDDESLGAVQLGHLEDHLDDESLGAVQLRDLVVFEVPTLLEPATGPKTPGWRLWESDNGPRPSSARTGHPIGAPQWAWPPIDRRPRTTWSGAFFTSQC